MKDSTKKRLIIAGLAAVSVLLIFGISRVLYKEPVQELPKESKPTEEVELMVDTEETGQVQLSGNGTDCRIACPLPVRTSLQIQIDRHRPVWQLCFINFFPSHPAS